MNHTIAVASRTIYPNEFEATSIVSAEHSLRAAIARTHRTKQIKAIFLGWPNLETIAKKFARMVTHGFPSNCASGHDLLSEVLNKAVQAYEAASLTAINENELGDAFMKAIINEGVYLSDYEVHGLQANGTSEYWEPLSMPLCDWVRKRNVERLVFSPRVLSADSRERNATRLILAGQLLSVADARRMTGILG